MPSSASPVNLSGTFFGEKARPEDKVSREVLNCIFIYTQRSDLAKPQFPLHAIHLVYD